MLFIAGGSFWMGSNEHYPEEAPARRVWVDGFWIDEAPVTNREYQAFVAATGHVTLAEHAPDAKLYPGADPAMLRPGSSLFVPPKYPVSLNDPFQWWSFSFGTSWRHPWGPESSIDTLLDHPVVHVACADAEAYARWAEKELPTEAEWELAARGGLDRQPYAWGGELAPSGTMMANYWQGTFPHENLLQDGYERTSPVRSFAPNGHGLYDMIGNVWEWTCDWYVDAC
jgi:formylglycine-generating enzyme